MKEQATITEPKLYTTEEAAKVLKIGRSTVYKLMDEGKLKYAKLGSRRVITQAELVRLVNDSMVA